MLLQDVLANNRDEFMVRLCTNSSWFASFAHIISTSQQQNLEPIDGQQIKPKLTTKKQARNCMNRMTKMTTLIDVSGVTCLLDKYSLKSFETTALRFSSVKIQVSWIGKIRLHQLIPEEIANIHIRSTVQ